MYTWTNYLPVVYLMYVDSGGDLLRRLTLQDEEQQKDTTPHYVVGCSDVCSTLLHYLFCFYLEF